jgi:D-glycero-D-manno-heptose 1,7-bisphosphate phosphatase
MELKSAVFLDRDGVINTPTIINGKPYAPIKLKDFEIIDGVAQAIQNFTRAGLEVVVITNQPEIARHQLSQKELDDMHNVIKRATGIKNFYCCTHIDEDLCKCRKPKPGLLNESSTDLNLNLKNSFLVGDRWRDIEAGQTVGCKCFFIDYSYREKQPKKPYTKVRSLLEASKLILGDLDNATT